jgi:hypothetical protein
VKMKIVRGMKSLANTARPAGCTAIRLNLPSESFYRLFFRMSFEKFPDGFGRVEITANIADNEFR